MSLDAVPQGSLADRVPADVLLLTGGTLRSTESQNDRSAMARESLALRMFPKVFPNGMKTAPGVSSEGRFA
ncbi:MAG: hypothetical protein JWR13_7 [Mycobacterium sp.]|nr:hypothetical protein [Mycobacterium sp.]